MAERDSASAREGGRLRRETGKGSVVILAGIAAGAVSTGVLAKLLPLEAFGAYIFGTTLLNYAVIVARAGVESSIVRFLNQYDSPALASGFLRWVDRTTVLTSLWVTAAILALGGVAMGRVHALTWPLLLLSVAGILPLSSIYVSTAVLRAQRRVMLSLLPLRVLRPILATLIALPLLFMFEERSLSAVAAEVLALVLIAVPVHRLTVSVRRPVPANIDAAERALWGATTRRMTIGEVAQQVAGQVDVLLVGAMFGIAPAGLYGLASRLARLVLLGNKAANSVASPVIARSYHSGDTSLLQAAVSHTCTIAGAATLVACAALALLPLEVYHWLGPGYAGARPLMFVLLVAQVVNAITGPVGIVLVMTGNEKSQAVVNIASGAVLLAGIPIISAVGGSVLHVALLLAGVIAISNVVKAVIVYKKTGVISLPLVQAHTRTLVVDSSNRRWYRLLLLLRDVRSKSSRVRVARGSNLGARRIEIGYGTRINGPCVAKGTGELRIGPYCAIGHDVRFITSNHATGALNLNLALQRRIGATVEVDEARRGIEIGANVWIGDAAIVLPGISIGPGAIVGAGAIVSKSVPAFGVCVGNPGRVVRMRFSEDVCQALANSSWWELPESTLAQFADVFSGREVRLQDIRLQALIEAAGLRPRVGSE